MAYECAPVEGVPFWERPIMVHGGGTTFGPGPAGQVCVMPQFDASRGGAQSTTWPPPVTAETEGLQARGCRPTGRPCGGPAGYQGQLWECSGPFIGTPGPLDGFTQDHPVATHLLASLATGTLFFLLTWWLLHKSGAANNPEATLIPIHERYRVPTPMYAVKHAGGIVGTVTSIDGAWRASVVGLGKVRDFTGLDQAADWVIDRTVAHRAQRDAQRNPSYEREALLKGIRVEREHDDVTGGDPEATAKIAMAHLDELPDYYDRLERCVEAEENGPRQDAASFLADSEQKLYEAQACVDSLDVDCARRKALEAKQLAERAWEQAPEVWLGRRGLAKQAEHQYKKAHHFLWDIWDATHARSAT